MLEATGIDIHWCSLSCTCIKYLDIVVRFRIKILPYSNINIIFIKKLKIAREFLIEKSNFKKQLVNV
jgi:hypothetical protein